MTESEAKGELLLLVNMVGEVEYSKDGGLSWIKYYYNGVTVHLGSVDNNLFWRYTDDIHVFGKPSSVWRNNSTWVECLRIMKSGVENRDTNEL